MWSGGDDTIAFFSDIFDIPSAIQHKIPKCLYLTYSYGFLPKIGLNLIIITPRIIENIGMVFL